jgi:hypothetical protein
MTETDWMVKMLYKKRAERMRRNIIIALLAAVSAWFSIAAVIGTVVTVNWLFFR